jgi:hypothetical protein
VETYDLCVAENLARSEAGVRAGSDPPKNDARVNLGATVTSKDRYFVLTAAHVLDTTNFDERWLLKYQYGTAEAAVARRVALPASSSTHDLATDIGIPKIEKTSEHLVHPTLPHIHTEGYGLNYLVPGIYDRLPRTSVYARGGLPVSRQSSREETTYGSTRMGSHGI